jgi:hypothetical protein
MEQQKYKKVEPYDVVIVTTDGDTHRFEEVVSCEVRMVTVQVWTIRERTVFQRLDVELIIMALSKSEMEVNKRYELCKKQP